MNFEISDFGNTSICQRKLNKAHQIFQLNIISIAIPLKEQKKKKKETLVERSPTEHAHFEIDTLEELLIGLMLLTSLLGGQELASQLLNKGCRGDSEALLCWTHPKSWPRVDLGGQDRRRGGKLQGGLLLCTDLPSTAPSPAGRCWSRPAWPGGTGSGSQDCPHLENCNEDLKTQVRRVFTYDDHIGLRWNLLAAILCGQTQGSTICPRVPLLQNC